MESSLGLEEFRGCSENRFGNGHLCVREGTLVSALRFNPNPTPTPQFAPHPPENPFLEAPGVEARIVGSTKRHYLECLRIRHAKSGIKLIYLYLSQGHTRSR
jgi:hypothetical protein